MELVKSYIVDKAGDVKSVILDYKLYKKMENIFLDQALAKAMTEIEDDEGVNIDEAKRMLNIK